MRTSITTVLCAVLGRAPDRLRGVWANYRNKQAERKWRGQLVPPAHSDLELSPWQSRVLGDLRRQGFCVTSLEAALGPASAEAMLHTLDGLMESRPSGVQSQTKPYVYHLLRKDDAARNIVRSTVSDLSFVLPVERYFRARAYCRAINVWLNVHVSGPPRETELWHFDNDDRHTVKAYIYMSDVERPNGPFSLIPAPSLYRYSNDPSHQAILHHFRNQLRVDDDAMARFVPPESWVEIVGRCGTFFFVDTCALYHRGVKPQPGSERVLFTWQYVTSAGAAPQDIPC